MVKDKKCDILEVQNFQEALFSDQCVRRTSPYAGNKSNINFFFIRISLKILRSCQFYSRCNFYFALFCLLSMIIYHPEKLYL